MRYTRVCDLMNVQLAKNAFLKSLVSNAIGKLFMKVNVLEYLSNCPECDKFQ
ncbi:unnamed protein product [Hymenolepis diminuta]|uniref:Uncharacterized protein n=1 Tax=Hymenolepis diminuta TaxID=6216 RepID=A0A564Y033_HYMDI|nr:unnamed protein product [Hymenolepis diminuta]